MLSQSTAQTSFSSLSKQLLEASRNGNEEDVRSLMSQGAPFTPDWLGMSPLHLSCLNGHLGTTQILARAGVSCEGRTKAEKTPIHFAAQYGHFEIVAFLIKLDSDINAIDMLHMTAVHWAVVEEHFLIIKLLVEHKADLNIKNKFDKTPIESAEDQCSFHIVEYLKSSQNHQTYEDETSTAPAEESSPQAALASLAALSGSPSLTDGLPWLNQDSVASGASVLLEGTNMITITEAGKLALQAWSNIYEDESNKETEENAEGSATESQEVGQKVFSISLANQMLNTPPANQSLCNTANQPLRFVVAPPNGKAKPKESYIHQNVKKRKVSSQEQDRDVENNVLQTPAPPVDPLDLQRQLTEAKSEAAMYREKLQIKEQEAYLWRKRFEIFQQSRT